MRSDRISKCRARAMSHQMRTLSPIELGDANGGCVNQRVGGYLVHSDAPTIDVAVNESDLSDPNFLASHGLTAKALTLDEDSDGKIDAPRTPSPSTLSASAQPAAEREGHHGGTGSALATSSFASAPLVPFGYGYGGDGGFWNATPSGYALVAPGTSAFAAPLAGYGAFGDWTRPFGSALGGAAGSESFAFSTHTPVPTLGGAAAAFGSFTDSPGLDSYDSFGFSLHTPWTADGTGAADTLAVPAFVAQPTSGAGAASSVALPAFVSVDGAEPSGGNALSLLSAGANPRGSAFAASPASPRGAAAAPLEHAANPALRGFVFGVPR